MSGYIICDDLAPKHHVLSVHLLLPARAARQVQDQAVLWGRKSQFSWKVQCVSCSLNIAQLRHMSSSCLPVRRRRRGCRRRPRRRGPSCRTPAGSGPCKEEQPHMTSTVLRPPCPQIQTTFLTKLSKNVSLGGFH